nr:VanZ family protein [Rhodoferax sp.]
MTISLFWRSSFWLLLLGTLVLSLLPVDQLPSAFNFWDKTQHAFGFAGLAVTGLLAYPDRAARVLLGLALFGIGIEFAQHLTGWRQGDGLDWVADCVGLGIGACGLKWRR